MVTLTWRLSRISPLGREDSRYSLYCMVQYVLSPRPYLDPLSVPELLHNLGARPGMACLSLIGTVALQYTNIWG